MTVKEPGAATGTGVISRSKEPRQTQRKQGTEKYEQEEHDEIRGRPNEL